MPMPSYRPACNSRSTNERSGAAELIISLSPGSEELGKNSVPQFWHWIGPLAGGLSIRAAQLGQKIGEGESFKNFESKI
jgi:hypothetical protein